MRAKQSQAFFKSCRYQHCMLFFALIIFVTTCSGVRACVYACVHGCCCSALLVKRIAVVVVQR